MSAHSPSLQDNIGLVSFAHRRLLSLLAAPVRWPRRIVDERRHWRTIVAALSDPAFCRKLGAGQPLPAGYGVGLSERVIEYPWLLGQNLAGAMLDAGCCLNHAPVLDALLPQVERLDFVTLSPERKAYPERSVSYLWADLRRLPLRDAFYDCVASLSTLEHVGMDTRVYGREAEGGSSAAEEMARAMAELRRVLRPGGWFYASVPFGRRENLGWMRQFNRGDVDQLIDAFGPTECAPSLRVYAYRSSGWRPSSADEVSEARYRTPQREVRPADRARNARAVACIALQAVAN